MSYTLTDLSRAVTTIDGKKLYVMRYAATDRAGASRKIEYAMYLYLPPDFQQKRVLYCFLIREVHQIGETVYEIDLRQIYSVIGSFRSK